MSNIFQVTNLDRNVHLIEEEKGLTMSYTLACHKDFPNKTKQSRKNNTAYYTKRVFIPYQNNMGFEINCQYFRIKNEVMLELNEFKIKQLQTKQEQLLQTKLNFI